jgi:hypothetical protein
MVMLELSQEWLVIGLGSLGWTKFQLQNTPFPRSQSGGFRLIGMRKHLVRSIFA